MSIATVVRFARRRPLLALALCAASRPPAFADRYDRYDRATRRGVQRRVHLRRHQDRGGRGRHPVAKVPSLPADHHLDVVALPVEVIAGFF
jgi:hypothetical protein